MFYDSACGMLKGSTWVVLLIRMRRLWILWRHEYDVI